MTGARSTHFAYSGEFRRSQNWIGGTNPNNASFVPPPVKEMHEALNDFEFFLHEYKNVIPLIHIALAHAQFETIHPFTDGNGRTGRLLITFLMNKENLIEKPVLFLSSYFKKFQKIYYERLNDYHDGKVEEWINFFLDGIIDTAEEAINVSKEIREIRDNDMAKIQVLAKRESESTMKVLVNLFGTPIVTTKTIMKWTDFSRPGAQKLIDRLTSLDILCPRESEGQYDKKYDYKKYLSVFTK